VDGGVESNDDCVDISQVGMSIRTLKLAKDFWRISEFSNEVLKCKTDGVCLGGTDPEKYCAEGHIGPYCAACDDGKADGGDGVKYAMSGSECVKCEGSFFWTFLLLCLVIVFLFFCWIYRDFDFDNVSVAKLDGIKNKVVKLMKEIPRAIGTTAQMIRSVRIQAKIVLSYCQIATGLSFNFKLVFPSPFKDLMGYLGVFNLDLFNISFVPIGCVYEMHYWRKMFGYSSLPLMLMIILILRYCYLLKIDITRYFPFNILPWAKQKLFCARKSVKVGGEVQESSADKETVYSWDQLSRKNTDYLERRRNVLRGGVTSNRRGSTKHMWAENHDEFPEEEASNFFKRQVDAVMSTFKVIGKSLYYWYYGGKEKFDLINDIIRLQHELQYKVNAKVRVVTGERKCWRVVFPNGEESKDILELEQLIKPGPLCLSTLAAEYGNKKGPRNPVSTDELLKWQLKSVGGDKLKTGVITNVEDGICTVEIDDTYFYRTSSIEGVSFSDERDLLFRQRFADVQKRERVTIIMDADITVESRTSEAERERDIKRMVEGSHRIFNRFSNKKTIKFYSRSSLHVLPSEFKDKEEVEKKKNSSLYKLTKPIKNCWRSFVLFLRGETNKDTYSTPTFSSCFEAKEKSTQERRAAEAASIFNMFLFFSFLVFPAVSTKVLHTWGCDKFDDGFPGNDSPNEGEFLRSDFSLRCYTSNHYWFLAWAAAMVVVYPFGIPFMYLVLLVGSKDELDPGQDSFVSKEVVKVGSEVLHSQIEGHTIMETAINDGVGKKVILDEIGALKESIRIRNINATVDSKVARLKFLYEAYEPKYFYFEVVESVRRLLLTCVVGFLRPGTAAQILMSIILCLASMRIYSGSSPFVSERIDKLAEIAQWQLFFTMLGALCLRTNLDGEDELGKYTFQMALFLIQMIIPVLMLMQRYLGGKDKALEDDGDLGDREREGMLTSLKKTMSDKFKDVNEKLGDVKSLVPDSVNEKIVSTREFINSKIADGREVIESSSQFLLEGISEDMLPGERLQVIAESVGSNFGDKLRQMTVLLEGKVAEVDVAERLRDCVASAVGGTARVYVDEFTKYFNENKNNPDVLQMSHASGLKSAIAKLNEMKDGVTAEYKIKSEMINKQIMREKVTEYIEGNLWEMKEFLKSTCKSEGKACVNDIVGKLKEDATYAIIARVIGGESELVRKVEEKVDAVAEIIVDGAVNVLFNPNKVGDILREVRIDVKKSGRDLLKELGEEGFEMVRTMVEECSVEGGGPLFTKCLDGDLVDRAKAACGDMLIGWKEKTEELVKSRLIRALNVYEIEFDVALNKDALDVKQANLQAWQAACAALEPESLKDNMVKELKSTAVEEAKARMEELKDFVKGVLRREIRVTIRGEIIPAIMDLLDCGDNVMILVKGCEKMLVKGLVKVGDECVELLFKAVFIRVKEKGNLPD